MFHRFSNTTLPPATAKEKAAKERRKEQGEADENMVDA
jgi:hypothetical protein